MRIRRTFFALSWATEYTLKPQPGFRLLAIN